MKKNEVEVKKLKKLRLSRETLHTLTSSDNRKVVGGVFSPGCGMSPRYCPTLDAETCDTQ